MKKWFCLGLLPWCLLPWKPVSLAATEEDDLLRIFIGLGQSLMVGSQAGDTLVSVEPRWPDQVLMFDGPENADVRMGLPTSGGADRIAALDPAKLTGFTPLVARKGVGGGNRGETPMESFANTLAAAARESGRPFRSLSFTAAQGGTRYSGLRKGTQAYDNLLTALKRARELAADRGWRIRVEACLVKHGEGDLGNEGYLEDLLAWRADIDADVKAITGQELDVHFIMHQPSTHRGLHPHSSLAMLEAHHGSPFHHLAGADYPFGAEYHEDELHMTGPGYYLIGEIMARAWLAVSESPERKPVITRIVSATREGRTVELTYEVPVPPLVFDTDTVPERDVKGYRFFDDAGEVGVLEAVIVRDGTGQASAVVELRLEREPSGSGEAVLYALSPQAATRVPEERVRGNVRDSETARSTLDGRPMPNWAVHQRMPVRGNP